MLDAPRPPYPQNEFPWGLRIQMAKPLSLPTCHASSGSCPRGCIPGCWSKEWEWNHFAVKKYRKASDPPKECCLCSDVTEPAQEADSTAQLCTRCSLGHLSLSNQAASRGFSVHSNLFQLSGDNHWVRGHSLGDILGTPHLSTGYWVTLASTLLLLYCAVQEHGLGSQALLPISVNNY